MMMSDGGTRHKTRFNNHCACVVCVVNLAEHKPDLQATCEFGRSAIEYAAAHCGVEGVKLLLQAGSPLPEGGVMRLVPSLQLHDSMKRASVGAHSQFMLWCAMAYLAQGHQIHCSCK
jgi:hypothetical protein